MSFELIAREILSGKKHRLLKAILKGLSVCYRKVITLRHFFYDRGFFKQSQVKTPVISIGNIVVGGTGKTPLVHLLAEELSQKMKVAILSRGYRSGDEPQLLQKKLNLALVLVGKDRSALARKAEKEGFEAIILDDGMQHRKLGRDFELVMIDGKDPFGHGHFLPRGFLRDCPSRLKVADLIVATHVDDVLKAKLATYSKAPIVEVKLQVEDAPDLKGKKVGLFCAIANPKRFKETLETLSAEVVGELYGDDHKPFSKEQLAAFAKKCQQKGAEMLLCTEKDEIKWPSDLKLDLPLYSIKIKFIMIAGQEHWSRFIQRIYERRN